jgi:hypothetical protein
MNLVEQQNMLKELSDGQLSQVMQSGTVPQYMVVAEAKRREEARKRYTTMKQKYDATVADQVMQGLQPSMQMLGGQPPMPSASGIDAAMSGGAPMPSPDMGGMPMAGIDAGIPVQGGGLDAAMPQQPPAFARGGAVHRYNNGTAVSPAIGPGRMSQLIQAGMLSPEPMLPVQGNAAAAEPAAPPAEDLYLQPLSSVGPDPYADLRDLYAKQLEGIQKEREQAGALALISAGVGIAGGKSQNVARNLAGAQDAIKGYQDTLSGLNTRESNLLTNRAQLELEAQRQAMGDGQEGETFGTTIQYAKDQDGNIRAYVVGNKGSIKEVPLPEGHMMIDPQDLRTMQAAGTAEGTAYNAATYRADLVYKQNREYRYKQVLQTIDQLEQYVKENPGLGIYSYLRLAGSAPANIKAMIDSVLSDRALATLEQMRRDSPTGGAMGNVTDRDMSLLMSARVALSQEMDQQTFLQQLARIRQEYLDNKALGDQNFDTFWGDFLRGQGQGGGGGMSVVPTTPPDASGGGLEVPTGGSGSAIQPNVFQ